MPRLCEHLHVYLFLCTYQYVFMMIVKCVRLKSLRKVRAKHREKKRPKMIYIFFLTSCLAFAQHHWMDKYEFVKNQIKFNNTLKK